MIRTESGLSLGSNEGDRLVHLSQAVEAITQLSGISIAAKSSVYETDPVGVKPQYQNQKFLNAVLIVETNQTAHEWYDALREIETRLGRHRSLDQYAPRAIDIDIIYFGDAHIESGGLVIPHAHWQERRFVAQPLAEVHPELKLPGTEGTVQDILNGLPLHPEVTLFTNDW